MAIPVWGVGQVLTAPDVNTWFVPLIAIKPSGTSRTSTTTLANDPDIVIPVAANAVYQFTAMLDYEADVTGDLKFQFTVPASASMLWGFAGFTGADSPTFNGGNTAALVLVVGGGGAGAARSVFISGVITTGGTAGNVVLQWAQSVSSGTASILHANTYLTAQRIG